MNRYRSFAVKAHGGSHKKSNPKVPCQDAASHFDKDPSVSIAVVADGHGDSNYFRSDKGAELAVACATRGIQDFVKAHEELFKPSYYGLKKPNPPSHKEFEKHLREKLIKQTIASWNNLVWDDYQKNPFTPDELMKASEKYRERYNENNRDKYKDGKYISKAYGTTLIAAAITPYYWFGFHIGDGRFTVLYPDGSGAQPIPWDDRCYFNVTTSICDDDVLEHEYGVRSHLSFDTKNLPIAFFLCTDGIDDNYPVADNKTHLCRLYRTIAVTFAEDGYDSTCAQLKDLMEGFATKGKGDDTTLAGFINMEEIKKVAPKWKEEIAKAEASRTEAKKFAVEETAIEKSTIENTTVEKAAVPEEITDATTEDIEEDEVETDPKVISEATIVDEAVPKIESTKNMESENG